MSDYQPYEENIIVPLIADGDEEAFGVFFREYYPWLKPFLAKFFHGPDQLEDALQETFIKIWINRDQLPAVKNIKSWIYTIASRICINSIRRDLTREKIGNIYQQQIEPVGVTPVDEAAASELKRLIHAAVDRMPPARRKIYLLSREEGLKPAQIAETLSISVNTVRNVLVSALKDIRLYLADHGYQIPMMILLSGYL